MLGNIQLVELILWYHKYSGNIIHIESKSKRRLHLKTTKWLLSLLALTVHVAWFLWAWLAMESDVSTQCRKIQRI